MHEGMWCMLLFTAELNTAFNIPTLFLLHHCFRHHCSSQVHHCQERKCLHSIPIFIQGVTWTTAQLFFFAIFTNEAAFMSSSSSSSSYLTYCQARVCNFMSSVGVGCNQEIEGPITVLQVLHSRHFGQMLRYPDWWSCCTWWWIKFTCNNSHWSLTPMQWDIMSMLMMDWELQMLSNQNIILHIHVRMPWRELHRIETVETAIIYHYKLW